MRKGLRIIATLIGAAAMIASLLGHVAVVLCLFRSWDAVAAITVFPIWIWAIFGLAGAAIGLALTHSKLALIPAAIWVITVLVGADERRSLMRGISPTLHSERDEAEPNPGGKIPLRVITINCLELNTDTVREAGRFNPDIIFVQEAPSAGALKTIATELWGDAGNVISAPYHCAIIARGKLSRHKSVLHRHGTAATLELPEGPQVELLSMHLEHATTRWDLWRRSCWREHRERHLNRRTQLETLLAAFDTQAADRPRIFGGDFNAPPTSNLFKAIPETYTNAFGTAGKGLGNTFINGFPVLRIDHLYAGPGLTVVDSRAARTKNSDHRLVIADLLLENPMP